MRYIFYHGSCYDGFGAAFAAWMKFGDTDTKYLPASYGKVSIMETAFQKEDEVYIVDYAIPNDEFEELVDLVSKVVVLDHHRTAMDRFTEMHPFPAEGYELKKDNVHVIFDMNRSGALISWEYFHPNKPIPKLIQWISDRDLWTFKLPETRAIHALLTSKKMDFAVWVEWMDALNRTPNLIHKGEAILDVQAQTVDMICRKAYITNIDGYMVPIVNATSHWSEVGYKLLEMYPDAEFSASYGDQPDGTRLYSLRSRTEGIMDVASLALRFGGGGHVHASGFKLPIMLQPSELSKAPVEQDEEEE